MLSSGLVQPMNEEHNGRDLYILYIMDHKKHKVFSYEHVYEEEIIEYIETGDFEYESSFKTTKN